MINGCRWCNAIAGPVDGHGAVRRHADCPHPTPAFCTARIVRRMAASVKGRGRVIDLKLLPGSLIIGTYPVGNCSTATSCPFSALIDLCFVGLRRFLITEILVGRARCGRPLPAPSPPPASRPRAIRGCRCPWRLWPGNRSAGTCWRGDIRRCRPAPAR